MQLNDNLSQSATFGGKATFGLISSLVAEMLTEGGETLVITAKAEEFIYDARFFIPVMGPVTFKVIDTHGAETELGSEFSMAGEIIMADRLHCGFSLYFFVKSTGLPFAKVMANMALLKGKKRLLPVLDSSATLRDALFDLHVKRQASCGDSGCNFGGRGYLLMSIQSEMTKCTFN
ncbi:MAG: hypothetical protein ACWGOX_09780 [Desulforhopalus sp.]